MRKFVPATLIAALALGAAACETQTQEGDTGMQEAETPEAVSLETVEAFRMEVGAKLDSLQAKIVELRSRAEEAGGDVQGTVQQEIDELDRQTEMVEQELDTVQDESAETWETVEFEIRQKLAELESSVEEVEVRLGDTA